MEYFANLPTNELTKELGQRIKYFNRYVEQSGLRRLWSRSNDLYFGRHLGETDARSSNVSVVGSDGEFAAFGVNHYRNLIKHILALTTSQKPTYDVRAKNTDLKSLNQAKLANTIIDSYTDEKRMGRHMKSAAERSLVFSKGFVYMTWEPSLGRPIGTEPVIDDEGDLPTPKLDENGEPIEKIIYEGDVEIRAKSPFDVIYDPQIRDWVKLPWFCVREYEAKHELAARYPKVRDDILMQDGRDELDDLDFAKHTRRLQDQDSPDQDMIAVYTFYHKRSDACPNGRMLKMINGDVALYDGPIPYTKKLPIFRITPGEVFDSAEGYTEGFDLMVLQEVANVLYSIPFTNQQAFATQAIWLPTGCEIAPSQIGKGMTILKGGVPGTEPKPLQLTATPAEVFTNIKAVESAMEKISGINSVVRGDPDSNLKSGAALGRVQAMAIQFASNFQQSWAELQEDVGTFLIDLLKDFAKTERMVAIAGKHNKGAMKSFVGGDLDPIDRVVVNLGNPLSRTVAGRIDMAEKLLEKGMVKNPQEFITVINTGNLDPMIEGQDSQNTLIKRENESLMDGLTVKAVVGDKHLLHAQEHLAVLSDPMLREAADKGDEFATQVVTNTLLHIQEHERLHATQTQFFSMISGEPPAPPPPMPPPAPGAGPMAPMPPNPQQPPEAPPIPPMPNMPNVEGMPA